MTEHPTHRHTEGKIDETNFAHHIVTPKTYIIVISILLVLTWLTVVVAYMNFGGLWNLVIALGLATVKATLVVLWFMHVKYSGRLIQVVIFTTLMFFALLLFGVLMDVWTRYDSNPTGYATPSTPEPTYVQRDQAGVEPGGEPRVDH
jgi:cytochrome c oxidase subunit 4